MFVTRFLLTQIRKKLTGNNENRTLIAYNPAYVADQVIESLKIENVILI